MTANKPWVWTTNPLFLSQPGLVEIEASHAGQSGQAQVLPMRLALGTHGPDDTARGRWVVGQPPGQGMQLETGTHLTSQTSILET